MALGRMGRRSRKSAPLPKLQITSMMDMFTIIMIFLLVSYSSKPETMQLDKSIELPKSQAKLEYAQNIKLVMTQTTLKLEDEVVATLDGETIIGLDPNKLKESGLYQRLKQYRAEADAKPKVVEEEVMPEGEQAESNLLFLCDRRNSFKTINEVIKTAGMAGFPNLQFAVLAK